VFLSGEDIGPIVTTRLVPINLENWICRAAMAPGHDFYIPFTIPLWGVVEPDHVHVGNHLNFVFHGDNGLIIGVTAYPVRDKFQVLVVGDTLEIHGPVKWFDKHSFRDYSPSFYEALSHTESHISTFLLYSLIMSGLCWLIFFFVYQYHLKPNLLKSGSVLCM